MSRVRAPSVTPIDQFGGTQVPLHCSGPGFGLGDAPLAQRQSNGLLIRRFWVRNPGGAPRSTGSDGILTEHSKSLGSLIHVCPILNVHQAAGSFVFSSARIRSPASCATLT